MATFYTATQKLTLPAPNGKQKTYEWQVDMAAAGKIAGWALREPAILADDLAGMATFFPHWVLAGMRANRPVYCRECQVLVVAVDGGMRCVQCRREATVDGLIWVGQLPVLMRTESGFEEIRGRLRSVGFAEIAIDRLIYGLVPLVVGYPQEWRQMEPTVRYAAKWLDAMGLPRSSGAHHLVSGGKACLFGWNEWQPMAIHSLLQERMVNHALSLIKIAAGHPVNTAFIGRSAH